MKQKLTAKEEEIMNIFWQKGELCIRELVDSFPEPRPGYTTVSKQVGILEEKKFLQRRPIANTFLYKPIISEREYHGITIGDVVNKYYSKSYSNLVLHFVEDKKMDLEELKEIIDLIERNDK
jgi:predicted transcriptional regulator